MEDNGVHLGIALEKGAKKLENRPDGSELVIRYEPLTGIHQDYYVEIPPSVSTLPPYRASELSVGGKKGGSTACYQPYVYAGKAFSVTNTNYSLKLHLSVG